jgi:hypothetical protein
VTRSHVRWVPNHQIRSTPDSDQLPVDRSADEPAARRPRQGPARASRRPVTGAAGNLRPGADKPPAALPGAVRPGAERTRSGIECSGTERLVDPPVGWPEIDEFLGELALTG